MDSFVSSQIYVSSFYSRIIGLFVNVHIFNISKKTIFDTIFDWFLKIIWKQRINSCCIKN